MTRRPRSLPNGPQNAVQVPRQAAVGGPKSAARQGVLSAVDSDPHPITVSGIMPGLQIRGLLDEVPIADWLCRCGHHERAIGRPAVIELTGRVHVGTCPHQTPAATEHERRNAA
ncbi:hypothetical protein QFW82_20850 [Streptomyces malaysiensis subsp. malaysiensis]|uniref:hypothetical protein n=1 Tax=Streptomyces malaysiensis TaxID=92644 RepID=UPI0024C0DA38|nr:hypothetical protein [Streptomyces sp. NA07423]WHX19329.1 hypothetical protein QFW82_20850 [Streptomyces sp. NA07423]